tara:strand:- start:15666 stop:15869 length:204 start_codon:yes stop_codon:yes gene_type:complete
MIDKKGGCMKINNHKKAFENALEKNRLSKDSQDENYVGKFMYMYSCEKKGLDFFKNIVTRKYLKVES